MCNRLSLAIALLWCSLIAGRAAVLYVDLNSTNPLPPYADWSTAATNIQDAVDVASAKDEILVTNGVYRSGGRLIAGVPTTNRVAVTVALTLQSVNGPAVTTIEGYQVPGTTNGAGAMRCVYLTNGSGLVGFTVSNGATEFSGEAGGGVLCQAAIPVTSFLSNCVIVGNVADSVGGVSGGGGIAVGARVSNCEIRNNRARGYGGGAAFALLCGCLITENSASQGGGTEQCVLTNCVLAGNSAGQSGGASYGDRLYNCTVTGNSVFGTNSYYSGGGVYNATRVANSIVYNNTAPQNPNYYDAPMAYCCTAPLPTGNGNITNAPLLVAPASGDYHLQSNSPCINSGNNGYVTIATDQDGAPRIAGGTVDMGAYEYQSPGSSISYAWLEQYGLATDGSADSLDSDGDGMNNWQEWRCGTDPTNALSVLKLLSLSNSTSGLTVTWQSVANRTYFLQRATNLLNQPLFSAIRSNVQGQINTTSFTDSNATGVGPYFYRVGVQ